MRYLVVNIEEAKELGLLLEPATLLAAIRYENKLGKTWTKGYRNTSSELLIPNKDRAEKALKNLLEKGLITYTGNGYKAVSNIATPPSNIATPSSNIATPPSNIATLSKESSKENINNIITPKKGNTPAHVFKKFKELFLSTSNINITDDEWNKCFEEWLTLSPEYQSLAVQYATKHGPKSIPTVWLKQRDFLNKLDVDIDNGVAEFKREILSLFMPEEVEKLFTLCFDVEYTRSTHKVWWKSVDKLQLRTLLESPDARCEAIVKLAYKHFQKREEKLYFDYKQI